jgi:hypothetical protein
MDAGGCIEAFAAGNGESGKADVASLAHIHHQPVFQSRKELPA